MDLKAIQNVYRDMEFCNSDKDEVALMFTHSYSRLRKVFPFIFEMS